MQREKAHLQAVLAAIKTELTRAHSDVALKKPKVDELFRQINRTDDFNTLSEYQLQSMLLSKAENALLGLTQAEKEPYFTRIDFRAHGKASDEAFYIGKNGVTDANTYDAIVVDWRAPVANLYYNGQLGPSQYETPDGVIEGELTKKRHFTIENGQLLGMFDADMFSGDKLLADALSKTSQGKLKEVVSTIQTEQNAVIRYPLSQNLIVQGVAGSGKTTIALHRIAYLLYTYQKSLKGASLMIIAPNPLFLDYISQVLPQLGVGDVQQKTYAGVCLSFLKEEKITQTPDDRLAEALSSPEAAENLRKRTKARGSLRFLEMLDDYLDAAQELICPREDIRFGPIVVMGRAEARKMLLEDMRPLPLNTRIQSFVRYLRPRFKKALADVIELYEEQCEKRAMHIKAAMADSPERQARLRNLYGSRDERIEQAKEALPKVRRAFEASMKPLSVTKAYAEFLGKNDDGKRYEEDLTALVWLKRRIEGFSRYESASHVVIDEAQDLCPAQIKLLSTLFANPTYTLVGDMGQNIHFYKDIAGWEAAQALLPRSGMRTLVTSYRSTVEIMEFAGTIATRHPYSGMESAKPVLRHGSAPAFYGAENEKDRLRAIGQAIEDMKESCESICVIEKTSDRAEKTAKALGLIHLRASDANYRGGLCVASIDQVKGLEFDGVVIACAGEDDLPDTPAMARLAYVAATRALHRLSLVHAGDLSPLFTQ